MSHSKNNIKTQLKNQEQHKNNSSKIKGKHKRKQMNSSKLFACSEGVKMPPSHHVTCWMTFTNCLLNTRKNVRKTKNKRKHLSEQRKCTGKSNVNCRTYSKREKMGACVCFLFSSVIFAIVLVILLNNTYMTRQTETLSLLRMVVISRQASTFYRLLWEGHVHFLRKFSRNHHSNTKMNDIVLDSDKFSCHQTMIGIDARKIMIFAWFKWDHRQSIVKTSCFMICCRQIPRNHLIIFTYDTLQFVIEITVFLTDTFSHKITVNDPVTTSEHRLRSQNKCTISKATFHEQRADTWKAGVDDALKCFHFNLTLIHFIVIFFVGVSCIPSIECY